MNGMKAWRTYPRWFRWLIIFVGIWVVIAAWDSYVTHRIIQRGAELRKQRAAELEQTAS
jgi:hypothetical protein